MELTNILNAQRESMQKSGFFDEFFPKQDENTRKVWEFAKKDLGKHPTQAQQFQVDNYYGMGQMDYNQGYDDGEEPQQVDPEQILSEEETNKIF